MRNADRCHEACSSHADCARAARRDRDRLPLAAAGRADDRYEGVALRQAADTLTDVDAFSAERDRILAEAGVTDSALIEFVRVHGATPGRMAVIWDSIAARLVDEEAEAR